MEDEEVKNPLPPEGNEEPTDEPEDDLLPGEGFDPSTPEEIAMIPPLPYVYDEEDSRVVDILNTVADFCGKEFTEVPPNPDGEKNPETGEIEGGVPVPLANEGIDVSPEPDKETPETDPDDEYGGNEHDNSGAEKYPEGTNPPKTDPENPDEDPKQDPNIPNPDLDKLRIAYNEALLKNTEEKTVYWAVLWQVIRLISAMACWTESHDDTFIVQWRKQVFDAKQINGCCKGCCRCDDDIITIPIAYSPLEKHPDTENKNPLEQQFDARPFIGGVIRVVVQGKIEETKIDAEYLNEHYDHYTGKLYINREDFHEILYSSGCGTCCLCERDLIITLYYNAGYYTIPQALLPLVCQLMSKVEDAKLPLSDCAGALSQVSGLLKSMKTGNIQYTWSDNDNKLANTQNLFSEIYNVASMAELFGLSRCDIVNKVDAGDVI